MHTLNRPSVCFSTAGYRRGVVPMPNSYTVVDSNLHHASHKKISSHFPLNPGYLIGILVIVYYNPHITGVGFHPQQIP